MKTARKILIVDDDAFFAARLKAALEKEGYRAETAANASETLAAFSGSRDIDLVLLDIDLGEATDGVDTAKAILKRRDVPIVFISGHTDPAIVKRTAEVSSYGFVFKESGDAVLAASLQMAFSLHDAHLMVEDREKRIARSEEKFSIAFNLNPEPAAITELDTGRIIDINRAFEEWSSYTREEAVGRTTMELNIWMTPGERERVIKRYRAEGVLRDVPIRFRLKDGRIIESLFSACPIEIGESHYLLSHIKDVSRFNAMTRELTASEERFRALAENNLDVIMLFDRECRHIYVNPVVKEQTGIPAADFIGKTHEELGFPPDLCALWRNAITGVLESGSNRRIEFQLPGGTWIDWLLVPQMGPDGKPAAVITSARDITTRKNAEIQISELIQRFEIVTAASGQVFYDYNKSAGTVTWSGSIESVLGYAVSAMIGDFRRRRQLIHPEDADAASRAVLAAEEKNEPYDISYRFLHADGRYIRIHDRGYPFRGQGPSGAVIGYIGVMEDITKWDEATQALRESEARFRFLTENSQDVVGRLDDDGRIRYVSPSCANIVGYGQEELTGRKVLSFIPDEDRPHTVEVINAGMKAGVDMYRLQHRLTHRDGHYLWVETVGRIVPGPSGGVDEIQFAVRDISERKRLEDAFRISEERFRSLVESAPEGICVVQDGLLHYVNPGMERMLGLTYEERGPDENGFIQYVHPDEAPNVMKKYAAFIEGKEPEQFYETALVHKDGRRIDVTFSIRWIEGFGSAPSILVYVNDITEIKKAESKIRASALEKEMLLKELQHRVKNSMALIASVIGLEAQCADGPATRDALTHIRDRVLTMSDLYTLLYDSEDWHQVSLPDYFTRVVNSIRSAYLDEQAGQRIIMETAATPIEVPVKSASSLGLILNELVTNSCKYGLRKGRPGTIRIRLDREHDTVILDVEDDGPGLPNGFSIEKSDGLGMQLVETLSLQLGGAVDYARGATTRFRVRVPLSMTG